MKVFKECCKNCLLSKDRIVSPQRAKEIIQNCKSKQIHFICHKASIEGKDIVCNAFYNQFGGFSQLVRIMERIGGIEFVEQTNTEKLTPYNQQTYEHTKRK